MSCIEVKSKCTHQLKRGRFSIFFANISFLKLYSCFLALPKDIATQRFILPVIRVTVLFNKRMGVFYFDRESFKQRETSGNSNSAVFSGATWWVSTLNCKSRCHNHLGPRVVSVGPLTQAGLRPIFNFEKFSKSSRKIRILKKKKVYSFRTLSNQNKLFNSVFPQGF